MPSNESCNTCVYTHLPVFVQEEKMMSMIVVCLKLLLDLKHVHGCVKYALGCKGGMFAAFYQLLRTTYRG